MKEKEQLQKTEKQREIFKNGKDIYPELRYSDSLHVYEEYKDIFEEQRIKYENGKRIQALSEIENIEDFKQKYDEKS